jgi:hypothetical protein
MSKIRKVIQEKFGYTTNLPTNNEMHDDVTERNGKDGKNPAYLPVEEYRKVIKALMGHLSTEDEGKIEDTVDFTALHRLANKHGFAPLVMNHLNTIQVQLEKPSGKRDRKAILAAWKEVQENIPFWFLGLLPHKEEMPESDKKNLANLLDIMAEINKVSAKVGKENAKDTEHAGRDTAAKKALNKARKDHDVSTEAASEKKLKQTPETEIKDK